MKPIRVVSECMRRDQNESRGDRSSNNTDTFQIENDEEQCHQIELGGQTSACGCLRTPDGSYCHNCFRRLVAGSPHHPLCLPSNAQPLPSAGERSPTSSSKPASQSDLPPSERRPGYHDSTPSLPVHVHPAVAFLESGDAVEPPNVTTPLIGWQPLFSGSAVVTNLLNASRISDPIPPLRIELLLRRSPRISK